jgi:hypothetical protein
MVKWLIKNVDELERTILSETNTFFDGNMNKVGKESTFIFKEEEIDAKKALEIKRTNIQPNSVRYKVNKLGLRGSGDFKSKKKKVAFFGCSFTFGWGVNEEDGFPHIIGTELFPDHEIINVGMPGTSIDTCVRYFKMVTDVVDIDYAIILLPAPFRTELPCENMHIKYANIVTNENHAPKELKEKFPAWVELNDSLYLKYRFLKNVSFIDQIATNKNVNVFFSTYDDDGKEYLNEVLPENKILPFFDQYELKSSFELPDYDPELKHFFARDGHHPGVYSNKVFSDKVIKKIKNIK